MQNTKQLKLDEASDDQIRQFAENTLQMSFASGTPRQTMLAQITPAWPNDFITVMVEPDRLEGDDLASVVPVAREMMAPVGQHDPKVEITIGFTEMPGGKDMVPVQVNGRNMILPRNVRLSIPYRFYLALMSAKREDVTQNERTREISAMEITNYPISFHKGPSEEEIAAWHKRVDGQELGASALVAA